MRYSKDDHINDEVNRLVSEEGWFVQRGGKHFKLYSPDRKIRHIIPGTPSDGRASLNWLSDLRRLKRRFEGDKPVNHIPKQPLYSALISPSKPPMEPMKQEPAFKTPKRLKSSELSFIQNLALKEGKTHSEIAAIYAAQGYKTTHGNSITGAYIANFISRNTTKAKSVKHEYYKATKSVKETGYESKQEADVLTEVMEVVSSNLSDELKRRFIRTVIGSAGSGS